MTSTKQIPVSAFLEMYQRSHSDVRALKSRLPERDVGGIVEEVLNRVKAHRHPDQTSVDRPSREKVERLCYALISDDETEGDRFIQSVYEDGASLEAIYISYLAEAAAMLGEWWIEDTASFYEVSIGTSRIYAIMRGLSYLFVPTRLVEVKSAVFASVPGEIHTLGIRMAADLFGKEGWDIDLMIGKSHNDLVEDIRQSRCRVIGLSAGGEHSAAALARLVIALRLSNPSASIFVSGQITTDAEEMVALMGFDGVVTEVPAALELASRLWERPVLQ